MTIHQPAAIVFDMLQDLYLLESGRLAYFGPIAAAQGYFRRIGQLCPAEVNPADFYLDLIYKAPSAEVVRSVAMLEDGGGASGAAGAEKQVAGDDGDVEWRAIYHASPLGLRMAQTLHAELEGEQQQMQGQQRPVYDEPSALRRLYVLTAFFLRYYGVNPGYYLYRAVYLVLCAVYIGTLYLNLHTNTSELIKYSGSIFFSIWATLFAAVGTTGLIASDRRQSFEQIKNGVITPSVSCLSMFLAALPYNTACAFAFQLIFHWVSNINPSGEAFIYAVILTFGHLTMMEAIMNIVVEVVKDAMLSVTAAMLVMGALFLLPGFFIWVSAMPVWISWMSWMMPTKVSTKNNKYNVHFVNVFCDVQYRLSILRMWLLEQTKIEAPTAMSFE